MRPNARMTSGGPGLFPGRSGAEGLVHEDTVVLDYLAPALRADQRTRCCRRTDNPRATISSLTSSVTRRPGLAAAVGAGAAVAEVLLALSAVAVALRQDELRRLRGCPAGLRRLRRAEHDRVDMSSHRGDGGN